MFNSSDIQIIVAYSMYCVQDTADVNYASVIDKVTIFGIEIFADIGAPSR